MKKYKTKITATQLMAMKQTLEHCLLTWCFEDADRIYKYALTECLKVVRQKLVIPEFKKEYKITLSDVQALALLWFWYELSDEYIVTDFTNKLHMMALEIHQQFS